MAVIIRSEKELDLNNGIKTNVEIVDGKLRLEVVRESFNRRSAIIPLTSNDTPEPFKARAFAAVTSYRPYMAFDKKSDTCWYSYSSPPGWIYYDFGPNIRKSIIEYRITVSTILKNQKSCFKSWNFEGSNDGEEWTILDSVRDEPEWELGEKRNYQVKNIGSYRFYRIYILENHGATSVGNIQDIDFIEEAKFQVFKQSGTIECPKIDLGQFYREIKSISSIKNLPEGTNVKVYTSTSNDNIIFSEFSLVDSEGMITSPQGRYVKIKIELTGKQNESQVVQNEFTQSEADQFEQDEQLIFDDSLRLRTNYNEDMDQDLSWQNEGKVFQKNIGKAAFKKIDKIRVY